MPGHPVKRSRLGSMFLSCSSVRVSRRRPPAGGWFGPNDVILCLQMNRWVGWTGPDWSRVLRPRGSLIPVPDDMPCLKQNFLVLEQSVSVDSKDVDALVSRIEGVLQLHSSPAGHKSGSVSVSAGPALKTRSCCLRLRNQRNPRGSPYRLPSSRSDQDQDWDQIRPWNRKRVRTEEADPHRLLQDLVLSGNLIKEAVRRLQFSELDCGDFSWNRTQDGLTRAADNVPCS